MTKESRLRALLLNTSLFFTMVMIPVNFRDERISSYVHTPMAIGQAIQHYSLNIASLETVANNKKVRTPTTARLIR
eukprot:scaffold4793_cov175-Amphora_coffeaeformis.AAC.10